MWRTSVSVTLFCLLLALASCGRATHRYVDTEDVEIQSISHTVDGDFLVVSAVLENTDDDIRHSVYRMQWFDASGAMIEQSAWRPLIVKGEEPVHITERSTVPGATEYTLILSNDES